MELWCRGTGHPSQGRSKAQPPYTVKDSSTKDGLNMIAMEREKDRSLDLGSSLEAKEMELP